MLMQTIANFDRIIKNKIFRLDLHCLHICLAIVFHLRQDILVLL